MNTPMIRNLPSLIFLIFVCCNGNQNVVIPIDPSELSFKKGDCLYFEIDSVFFGSAIVIDFSKDEGGLWYGLCFINYYDTIRPVKANIIDHKLFGRKVQSSQNKEGYIIALDSEFINDSCLRMNKSKINVIGHFSLIDELKIGSEGATSDYNKMIASFKYGLDKRKVPPDNYKEHINKLDNFRPEEYFMLKDFIKESK